MRHDNWQTKLSSIVEEKRKQPFEFSKWNCMFWCGEVVNALIGIDLFEQYRGKIKDEKIAAKLLRKIDNVKTAEDFFQKHLNEQKPVAFARHGDIVFAEPGTLDLDIPCGNMFGLIPGICYGQISYFVGFDGLVEVETLRLRSTIWVS